MDLWSLDFLDLWILGIFDFWFLWNLASLEFVLLILGKSHTGGHGSLVRHALLSAACSQTDFSLVLSFSCACSTAMLRTSISVGTPEHATVGPFIGGTYLPAGENHGKVVYQKTEKLEGLDTFLYF